MSLSKRLKTKTEHAGAKNGGGLRGTRSEAKQSSKKHRRTNSKKIIHEEQVEIHLEGKLSNEKIHPWRVCPYGQHWVKTHSLHVPPSKKDPAGSATTRHEHCAHNPSGRDQLYPEEMSEIATQNFFGLKDKPCPLPLRFKNGSKYDDLIAGWVQYWNEVMKPPIPLEPNCVKALIASESGFDPNKLANKKNSNSARGLMQITNETRKILGNEKRELKDHYIDVTKSDLNDPNNNICAGVRWLIYKRERASQKLGHSASWEEAIKEYKGLSNKGPRQVEKNMKAFLMNDEALKKCGK